MRGEGGYTFYRGFALKASTTGVSSKHFCSSEHSTYTPSISITYHEANMYHVNAAYGNRPFKAWGRLIDGVSPVYSFSVTTAGTYRIETLDSEFFGYPAPNFNSRLYLYDSNHNHLVQSTNDSGNQGNEYIERYLDVGTYHICVASDDTYMLHVYCYLAVYKVGELIDAGYWANCAYEYYKIQDPSPNNYYNCMGYAIGVYNDSDLGSGAVNEVEAELASYDWIEANDLTGTRVIAYGNEYNIIHFAKYQNGIVTAKMDGYEVVMHLSTTPYFYSSYDTIYKYYKYTG